MWIPDFAFLIFLHFSGFTAHAENEITCNKDGFWNPYPYCTSITDSFPIIQTIEEKSVCLQGSHEIGGKARSEWRVITTDNSTDGCIKAGNNAMYGETTFKVFIISINPGEVFLHIDTVSSGLEARLCSQYTNYFKSLPQFMIPPTLTNLFLINNLNRYIFTNPKK